MTAVTRLIITGEYPPTPGGVADFTRLLAGGLARAGERVHVVAPAAQGPDPSDPGVSILRVPALGPGCLRRVRREVARLPAPRRVLVQYAPHSLGWRGMNVAFSCWLSTLPDPVDVVFHEVAFPSIPGQPLRHALLARVQMKMARTAVSAASRSFVSTAAWTPLLRSLGTRREPIAIAIPSNLPQDVDPVAVTAIRRAIAPRGEIVIGHFGTYGAAIGALLGPALRRLLTARPSRHAILVGRGSGAFAAGLVQEDPRLAGRVRAADDVDAHEAAAHLAAADLLMQPYPDGATTRRTTLMAGLALGKAVVTTTGALSEPVWADCGAVRLAAGIDQLVGEAEALLADGASRAVLAARARDVYATAFSWDALIGVLRDTERAD